MNSQLVGSLGTCSVMGTSSTMACLTEATGIALPGLGSAVVSAPAVTADRVRIVEAAGTQAVDLAAAGTSMDTILTQVVFENGLRVLVAICGSTNAFIHLTAVAGRLGTGCRFSWRCRILN